MSAAHSLQSAARALGGDVSGGQILAPGPGHSSVDRSMQVKLDPSSSDGFVVRSFAGNDWTDCKDYVRERLGLEPWRAGQQSERPLEAMAARAAGSTKPKAIAEYVYKQVDGTPYLRVQRTEPKGFPQSHWTGTGWAYGKPAGSKIPYRLPELHLATHNTVFIVEGEKDADRLASFGFVATTSSEGAGKWTPELNEHFRHRCVYILADNDLAGRKHAKQVAENLLGIAAEVRVVGLPGLPEKGDVSDWLDYGGNPDELETICRQFPAYVRSHEEPPAADATEDIKSTLDEAPINEDTAALHFQQQFEGKLRYCHDTGAWFSWQGAAWRLSKTGEAFHFARVLARELSASEPDRVRFVNSKTSFAGGVEKYARHDPAFAVTNEVWDSDPFLLGTPGGTVDLRTGHIRAAESADGISKLTATHPAETADCPLWTRFLRETAGGDEGLVRFLQQWCGYSLTGDTREHALVFGYGPGGNGKSVFQNVVAGIMGDYATTAAMDTFTASRGDRHPTELAMLRGARLVTASETEEGKAWAESRIKQMTGGDKIQARFMRQDFFEFVPTFKLMIIGNHKPVLRNVDEAARRRLNIIPFTNKPTNPDRQLEEKLRAEWPAILRWMIEGCLDWQQNGLVRPDRVKAATEEYFDNQDSVGAWLAEECDIERPDQSDMWEKSSELFESWSKYAVKAGEPAGTKKSFGEAMQQRGFLPCRQERNTVRAFAGLRLKRAYGSGGRVDA